MKRTTAILLLCLISLLLMKCSQGEKRIVLRFKYEPGMTLTYEQTTKEIVVVTEADSVIKDYTHTYFMTIEQRVERFIDDSTVELFERDAWQFERPNKEDSTKIDTVTEERELTLQVLPSGKVTNVEFADKDNITVITYIKNYYEQGMPIFPSGELSAGYSWTQTTKVVLPDESMEASTTYRVKSLVREAGYDCAVIEYQGNMVIPIEPHPDDTTRRSGIDRIQTDGMIYFAYREGMVVRQREQWMVDGDRQKLSKGEMLRHRVATELDVDFKLVKREGI